MNKKEIKKVVWFEKDEDEKFQTIPKFTKEKFDADTYYRIVRQVCDAMVDDCTEEEVDSIMEKVIEKSNLKLNFLSWD